MRTIIILGENYFKLLNQVNYFYDTAKIKMYVCCTYMLLTNL